MQSPALRPPILGLKVPMGHEVPGRPEEVRMYDFLGQYWPATQAIGLSAMIEDEVASAKASILSSPQ
jgi:hypothetical protein